MSYPLPRMIQAVRGQHGHPAAVPYQGHAVQEGHDLHHLSHGRSPTIEVKTHHTC